NTCYNFNVYGINLEDAGFNNVVSNNTCNYNGYGISFDGRYNNIISNNTCIGNTYGIFFGGGISNNTVSNNTCTGNIEMGMYISHANNTMITNNNCTNNTNRGILVESAACYNRFENNTFNNNSIGFLLAINCQYNTVLANNITGNRNEGIRLWSAHYNNITGNTIINNGETGEYPGIFITLGSYGNLIQNNTVIDDGTGYQDVGIHVLNSNANTIENNTILQNVLYGILIENSDDSIILDNNVSNNLQNGINVNGTSENNTIYLNYFSGNVVNQSFSNATGLGNAWDNGSVGNYWSDFVALHPDAYSFDGLVWNESYEIRNVSEWDNYPLIGQVSPVASFTSNNSGTIYIPGPLPVQFNFTGILGNAPLDIQWDFGDGSANSSDINPVHQYTTEGTFNVTLTIIDGDGESSTFREVDLITYILDLQPVAAFEANTTVIISGQWVQFTYTGTYGNLNSTYQWSFSDGGLNDTAEHPIRQFNATTYFTIVVTITDANLNSSTFISTNYIQVLSATGDYDKDGLNNQDEIERGTDPLVDDTDGDGFDDGEEVENGTDPLDRNSYPTPPVNWTLWIASGILIPAVGAVVAFLIKHSFQKATDKQVKKRLDERKKEIEQVYAAGESEKQALRKGRPESSGKYEVVLHDFVKQHDLVEKANFKVAVAQVGVSESGSLLTELYRMDASHLMRIKVQKVDEVLKNIKGKVKEAHDNEANIIVFPEMSMDLNYDEMVDEISKLAKKYEMYIITGGYHDVKTKQNICVVFGPKGIRWQQDKHIPATIHFGKEVFTEAIELTPPPGKIHVCDTEYGRIAIAICRDFLDMDLRVELKNCEPPVDLVFNPAYTPVTADFEATHFDVRRAVYAYSFFCNIAEYGGSLIYTPEKDRTKWEIPPKEEGIIYKDVDLFQLRAERRKWERLMKKGKKFIQSTRT
ncbi:MAG: NosD domain-containing protein, partial [Candidatus Hodarchaeota archaeon]